MTSIAAIDAAGNMVDQLLEERWQPSDFAGPRRGRGIPSTSTARSPAGSRTENPSGTTTRSSTVASWGSRGLERPAIVLAVHEAPDRERARERLYVGLSRALLFACGDPRHIENVGGPDVQKLGGWA